MIPGATLVTISRAGHAIRNENPEDLIAVFDAFFEPSRSGEVYVHECPSVIAKITASATT
jgi:hypothetical protein